MSDPFWLCLHLDKKGYPCNRRTMKPLSMCSLHREPLPHAGTKTRPGPTAEYQRQRRARLAQAGLSPLMEGA